MSGSQQVAELCFRPFHQSHSCLCTLNCHGYSTGGSTRQEGFTSLILPQSTASQYAKDGDLQGQTNSAQATGDVAGDSRFPVSAAGLQSLQSQPLHLLSSCPAADSLPSAQPSAPRPADTAHSQSHCTLQCPENGKWHISPEQA